MSCIGRYRRNLINYSETIFLFSLLVCHPILNIWIFSLDMSAFSTFWSINILEILFCDGWYGLIFPILILKFVSFEQPREIRIVKFYVRKPNVLEPRRYQIIPTNRIRINTLPSSLPQPTSCSNSSTSCCSPSSFSSSSSPMLNSSLHHVQITRRRLQPISPTKALSRVDPLRSIKAKVKNERNGIVHRNVRSVDDWNVDTPVPPVDVD